VLCNEILSKDDRMTEMEERVEDYLQFGVPYVWVINPENGQAWIYTSAGRTPANGVLRAGSIEVLLAELFRDE
jgi:Uma2 family endonuclease